MTCRKCGSDMQRTGAEEVKREKGTGESYSETVQRAQEAVLIKSYRCPVCGYEVSTTTNK